MIGPNTFAALGGRTGFPDAQAAADHVPPCPVCHGALVTDDPADPFNPAPVPCPACADEEEDAF
ncbi:MAG: hypothetical protein ABL308_12840 [Oceanicaulis sp.]